MMSASSRNLCVFYPQNGVCSSLLNDAARSEDSPPKKDCKHTEAPHRPLRLELGGSPSTLRRALGDSQEDESLPNTPVDARSDVKMEGRHPACGGDVDATDSDTAHYIYTFLKNHVSSSTGTEKRDKVQETMKRVVEKLLLDHQCAYNGMLKKLNLDGSGGYDMSFVTSVAVNVFADGTTNWGRIASLLAFGAAMCQYQKARGRDHCVSLVAKEISSYLLSHQREWLVKNKSWDGFVDFFQVSDPEATVRNTLMLFAGFAGLGATIAFLIR